MNAVAAVIWYASDTRSELHGTIDAQSMHCPFSAHLTPGHLHLLQSAKIVSSVCSRRTYMLLLSAVYYVAVNRDPTRVQPHRPIKKKVRPKPAPDLNCRVLHERVSASLCSRVHASTAHRREGGNS